MSYKRVNETHINVDEIVTVRDLLNLVKKICIDSKDDKESLLKSKVVFVNSLYEAMEIPNLIDSTLNFDDKQNKNIFDIYEDKINLDNENNFDLDI